MGVKRVCILGDDLAMGESSYLDMVYDVMGANKIEVVDWSRPEASAMKYIMDDAETLEEMLASASQGAKSVVVVIAVGYNDRVGPMPEILDQAWDTVIRKVMEFNCRPVLLGLVGDDIETQVCSATGTPLVQVPDECRAKIINSIQEQREVAYLDHEEHGLLGQALANHLLGEFGKKHKSSRSKTGEMLDASHGGHGGGGRRHGHDVDGMPRMPSGHVDLVDQVLGADCRNFDGFWVHKDDPEHMRVIDGSTIRSMRHNTEMALHPIGNDSFYIVDHGQQVRATMIGDELRFDNGEIWTLMEESRPVLDAPPLHRHDSGGGVVSAHEHQELHGGHQAEGCGAGQIVAALDRAEKCMEKCQKESSRYWQNLEEERGRLADERAELQVWRSKLQEKKQFLHHQQAEVSVLQQEVERSANRKGFC